MYAKAIKPVSDKNNHIVEHHHQHHHHCFCCRLPHMLGVCVSLSLDALHMISATTTAATTTTKTSTAQRCKWKENLQIPFMKFCCVGQRWRRRRCHQAPLTHRPDPHAECEHRHSERAREQSLKSLLLLLFVALINKNSSSAVAASICISVGAGVGVCVWRLLSFGTCRIFVVVERFICRLVALSLTRFRSFSLLVCTCSFVGGNIVVVAVAAVLSPPLSLSLSVVLYCRIVDVCVAWQLHAKSFVAAVFYSQTLTHTHTLTLTYKYIFVDMCTLWFIMRVQ